MTETDNDLVPAKEIDWLRSMTTTTVERVKTKANEPEVRVEHIAYFAIERGYVMAMKPDYGKQAFVPEFMSATWRNSVLTMVRLSGKRLLKGGGQGKDTRDREWGRWSNLPLDREDLPQQVRDALESYELAVATLTGGPR